MDNKEISNIILDLKEGKTERYALLINEYKHMVYALCLKMTLSKEDAEEITQDVFVKAYLGIKRFKGKARFSTWLYQIAYFTALGHLRKQKQRTEYQLPENLISNDKDVLSEIHHADQQAILEEAMTFLKPQERAIISLFYFDEFTVKDIAKITKLSESNVKVKVHRVRKKLHRILNTSLKRETSALI